MTDNTIYQLIKKLNKNRNSKDYILRPLSEKVHFGFAYVGARNAIDSKRKTKTPYRFYFIEGDDQQVVAAVLNMDQDLHWFVSPAERGKGHLTKALKSTILPHLFMEKDTISISINESAIGQKNFFRSEKLATSLGFTMLKAGEYSLNFDSFKSESEQLILPQLSEKEASEFSNRLNEIVAVLDRLTNEMEVLGTEYEFQERILRCRWGLNSIREDLIETIH